MFDNLIMSMNSKLKKVISGLETNEGKIDGISADVGNTYTKANSAASNTATNNTASKTGVLSAKLAYIISLLENTTYGLNALKTASSSSSAGVVKKIQRGTFTIPVSSDGATVAISLTGFTDVSKMSVRVYGNALEGSTGNGMSTSILPYVHSLTVAKLTFATDIYMDSSWSGWRKFPSTGSYEVIEFY